MKIEVSTLHKAFDGTVALDGLEFIVEDGAFYCLLGPSSAGKTTALRTICGLELPDKGRVVIDGRDMTGAPARGRDLAMVFQSFALYPHMTAWHNLAYPLREAGLARNDIASRVGQAAELLRISHVLDHKPGQLSGGEQQRVAIGRALVRRPRALLLDEPLTNLDAKLRDDMRAEFKRLHRDLGITMIYATPDQLEATTMASRIGILSKGRLIGEGAPAEIYEDPQTVDAARLIGSPPINLLNGTGTDGAQDFSLFQTGLPLGFTGEVIAGLRPADMQVARSEGDLKFPAKVSVSEPLGDIEILELQAATGPLRMVMRGTDVGSARPGEVLPIGFDPGKLLFFAADSGRRIAAQA